MTVARAAEKLNVELPVEYLDELAHADEVAAVVSSISATGAGELHDAVIDAVSAGRDYRTDKNVSRLLVARQIAASNIEQTARTRADHELRETLTAFADIILTGWADALEPHTAALTVAADAFPDLDLHNADAAVARGGDAMGHAHAVQVADRAWSAAVVGFGALAAVARVSRSGQPALVYTPARAAEFALAVEAARTKRKDLTAFILAKHGVPLRLATLTEYRKRVDVFKQDREAAERDAEETRLERVAHIW
ncbi:aldehyde dehydrogenase [Mycobacterium asiaticum]|uniref:aldehyde dehydrogenase n=1 Tax=Mycobacterium asiaticum TaxID=1790 RepID=UPI0012DB31BA|nr:aldehyde dehydrogenase [Mycobacterium asiaticum]